MEDGFEENAQILPDSPGYDAPEDRPAPAPMSGRNKGKGRAQPAPDPEFEPEAMDVDDAEQQQDRSPSPVQSRKNKSRDDAEQAGATPGARRDKGKGRTPDPVEDEDMDMDVEGDIANGLQDVNLQPDSDGEQEEEEPPRKKPKKEPVKRKRPPPRTQEKENEVDFGDESQVHIKLDNGPDEGSYSASPPCCLNSLFLTRTSRFTIRRSAQSKISIQTTGLVAPGESRLRQKREWATRNGS